MTVTVRAADVDDLDAVLEVGHRTWPATYEPVAGADYVTMGLAKWWTPEATLPALRAGRILVAEVDGKVVGMSATGPLDGRMVLWKLYVLPEAQGRGAGSALVDAVIAAASDAYDEIRLAYLDGNDAASAFYRKKGFVEAEREAGGHGIPDSIWLVRSLRDPASTAAAPEPEDEA